jgi:hypothetical protein
MVVKEVYPTQNSFYWKKTVTVELTLEELALICAQNGISTSVEGQELTEKHFHDIKTNFLPYNLYKDAKAILQAHNAPFKGGI